MTPETAVAPPQHIEVEDLNEQQRNDYLKYGADALPLKELPKPDESAPSKPADEPIGKGAESGTAKQEPPKRKNADARKEELGTEINQLLEKRRILKTDTFWQEFEEFKKTRNGKPAESSAATAESKQTPPSASQVPQLKRPELPEVPMLSAFVKDGAIDVQGFDAAQKQYAKESKEFPEKLRQFEEAEQSQARFESARKKADETWIGVRSAGEEMYGSEWGEKLFSQNATLPPMTGAIYGFILEAGMDDRAVAAALLDALDSNREKLQKFNALPLRKQFKSMEELESEIRKELSKAQEPAPPKPEKKITSAGKPPSEVGGRTSTPEDDADAALQRGDGEAYRRIMNQRDIAARKARKGR